MAPSVHATTQRDQYHMLRITTENRRGKLFLSVEGSLSGPRVATLEQCWRELSAASPRPKFCINLCGVSFIDNAGKVLLKEMYRQGAEFLGEGCLNQAIVTEIIGPGRKTETRDPKDKDKDKDPSKGSPFIFYIIFLSLLLVPAFTGAQTKNPALPGNAPTDTWKLTLEESVALAIKQNPTQQIAVLNAAESIQDKNITRSDLLPQADFQVADSATRENVKAQFGSKLPPGFPFPGHIGPYQIFSAGPTFGTSIFDFTLWKRYQAARSSVDSSKANSLSTREQVILLVVSQYIGTLRAVANVEASKSRVDLAQALYDQAADLQKEGVGTGIDTLRANVELQNEKQRLLEAQATRETSLFGLSRLLNLDPRQQIELGDSLSFFDTPQPDVATSIEEGLSARHEWKSLQEQMRAAENQRKAAFAERLPAVHFSGSWEQFGTEPVSVIPTYTYAGTVSVPLFTGGRIRAETVRADLDIQKLRQQQADLRNQIALDVKTALINLDSARSQVRVANLGVHLSREEVDQARDRFNAGVANNIEVIQAQDSLARANDNQIAALYRFNQARADLARSIGQMEKVYAK